MKTERLQKVLARAGVGSRRKAEEMIAAGRVTVNGQTVTAPGVKVDASNDSVALDGRPVEPERLEYWVLHKPTGVITTVDDPWGRPAARDLVPTGARVYPVGRLDADSSGLLIFTNDGQLAYELTHPRFEHEKEYHVQVPGRPAAPDLRRLRRGVLLEGRRTAPAKVEILRQDGHRSWLRVIIHEGRKRQVRCMLDAVGFPVRALKRVRVGPIGIGDLPEGKARRLTAAERAALRGLVKGPAGLGG